MTKFSAKSISLEKQYQSVFHGVAELVVKARHSAARFVNAAMTAAYWLIGRYIVKVEQAGAERAKYRTALIERLAVDLTERFGRCAFFYQTYPPEWILHTLSGVSTSELHLSRILQAASGESGVYSANAISETVPEDSSLASIDTCCRLPWSAYVRLLSVKNSHAREFYEAEALRGGWSVRQLDRQINSQFYERSALSKNKADMLARGQEPQLEDAFLPEEAIKDPFVLEFLDLKDEYSENDLEEALIRHLETFLLELGRDFCFMGRQRRLRIGDAWYRVDLLFFIGG